ncbi:ABC transporter permease [uncultured Faecalibacterium sp.]|uniref:ABC transporter permease n=1 Tax=uncultured Faecalibacterium sp. TaxID=259315 RepID=UPI0028038747|nr:ABC transporter permease [uncultured Faecalibacterium sp.]
MKLIVTFAFYFLYWFICFLCTGTDRKNLAGLRSYPDAVQKAVREHPVLGKAAPQEKSTAAILLSNLLLFTVVFSVLGLALKSVLGLNNYLSAFWYFLAFGEGLGLFDLLVIDLLWWRSTKRIRFSFLPEKKYYQDPKKHIESFLHGMPLFAAIAALTALIVTVL